MGKGGENLPLSLLTPPKRGGGGVGGGTPPAFPWRNRPPTPRKLMDHRRFRTGHRGSFGKKPSHPTPRRPIPTPPPAPPHPPPHPPTPPPPQQEPQTKSPNPKLLRGRRLEQEALKFRAHCTHSHTHTHARLQRPTLLAGT